MRNLQNGSRGPDVSNLQNLLNSKSPHGPRLVADGVFGRRTRLAVVNFQRNNRLSTDGVAGPLTMAALESSSVFRDPRLPTPSPTPVSTAPVSSSPTNRPTYRNIVSVYGDPEDTSYARRLVPPFPLYYQGTAVSSIRLHERVIDSMATALAQILSHYGLAEIERLRINHDYAGSMNKRRMRGGTQWSTHAWGVAIDLNAGENQLRWGADRALFAKAEYKAMIDIFEDNGWYSLGRYENRDFMHFQAVRI